MAITLYDGSRSPNARKVRLLAAELGIPLQRVHVDFTKGEMRASAYLAKNPNGKVPTLEEDGFVLWESAAILRYLAAKKPERGFLPSDARAHAAIDQWLFWWGAQPESALYLLVVEKLVKPFLGQPGNDAAVMAVAHADLARFLPILDRQLEGRAYVLGELGIVDFGIAPWFDSAPHLGVDTAGYPAIGAWMERMRAKPYWKDA